MSVFRENEAARSYPVYAAVAGLEFHRATQNEAEHSRRSVVPADLANRGRHRDKPYPARIVLPSYLKRGLVWKNLRG